MPWIPAALKNLFHRHPPKRTPVADRDPYGWHLPHYPYNSDKPRCTACGTDYPCDVARSRNPQGGTS
jgi:hypothetical protein